ncbi:MAG: group II intron reverse transcriptase/maturase [Actinobacteria bacterium]|nr:group II intron reverse transcriptase/maturase [Actinomycetota bacterium]
MGLRVKESGESESRPVMGRTGIEPNGKIIPRESEQTSTRSLITRELGKPTKGAKQMATRVPATVNEMEAGSTVGAASHAKTDWDQIDWHQVERNVSRLQARIVKATQEGRWGKVKALQHLLTHSRSARLLAIKRVTENQGKRTPGVDGVLWNTPEKKAAAVQELHRRGYQPQRLRRVYILKSNGKMRPLGIPIMRDRAMQALYLLAPDPIAETNADPNSYGFRRGGSTADAIQQCHTILSRKVSAEWVLEADIKSCFDRISHEWLLGHVPMDRAVLHRWLKAGFMEKRVLHPTDEGTPQGGVASPVLANMTLDGLEKLLRGRFPKLKHRGKNAKVNVVRYADDVIVTGSSRELLEDEVKPLVEKFLGERGPGLSQEKTVITHIRDGFDFLDQTVRRYGGKTLTKPSKKNVKAFLAKVRKTVKENKQATVGNLMLQLNPLIRGWAEYHRHAASKATFAAEDHDIFKALWIWAIRRHPMKSHRWVKERYFKADGLRNWVLSGDVSDTNGRPRRVRLFPASSMPIVRHVKIREEANPYDPAWYSYFDTRDQHQVRRSQSLGKGPSQMQRILGPRDDVVTSRPAKGR